MIFNKLKQDFLNSISPEYDESRRRVIKTAAGLAALTVVGVNLPSLLKISQLERQIAWGLVTGQTFYLYEPVVIDIPNVVIRNCNFKAMVYMAHMLIIKSGATGCLIHGCNFFGYGNFGTGIKVEPQIGDMTRTLQSAVNAASGCGGVVCLSESEQAMACLNPITI